MYLITRPHSSSKKHLLGLAFSVSGNELAYRCISYSRALVKAQLSVDNALNGDQLDGRYLTQYQGFKQTLDSGSKAEKIACIQTLCGLNNYHEPSDIIYHSRSVRLDNVDFEDYSVHTNVVALFQNVSALLHKVPTLFLYSNARISSK